MTDRRTFLQKAAGAAITATATDSGMLAAPTKASKMMGLEIGEISFVDEGTENGAALTASLGCWLQKAASAVPLTKAYS